VAELVEAGRQHRHRHDGEEQRRVAERLGGRGREPLVEEHPARDRTEGEHDGHDQQRGEEDGERRGQPPGHRRIGDDLPEPQGQQRVGATQLGLAAVGEAEQAEGSQRRGHQLPDVGPAHQPPRRGADRLGHLVDRPPAVDGLQQLV